MLEADINEGWDSSWPSHLKEYQGNLYFGADDGIHGNELWKYDGSQAELVSNIEIEHIGSDPKWFTEYNGGLFFYAGHFSGHGRLWKIEGDSLVEAAEVEDAEQLTVYNGRLFFSARDNLEVELWCYDGNDAYRVADINSGSGSSYPQNFIVFQDKLFFGAQGNPGGEQLWSFDGDTVVLEEQFGFGSYYPHHFTEFQGNLYFEANWSFWKYDGVHFEEMNFGVTPRYQPIVYQDKLFFWSASAIDGKILWSYDGLNTNMEVSGIWEPVPPFIDPFMTSYAGKLFFQVSDAEELYGNALWSYDGTVATMEADIKTGSDFTIIVYPEVAGEKLYFQAYGDSLGRELWSFYDSNVAINELDKQILPKAYPLPAGEGVNIDIPTDQGYSKALLFDSRGNLILSEHIDGSFQYLQLPANAGLYFLSFIGSEKITTLKIPKN